MVPRNSTPQGLAYIWKRKWVGIIAIESDKTQIHFLRDVLNAVASLDLKLTVPNILGKPNAASMIRFLSYLYLILTYPNGNT